MSERTTPDVTRELFVTLNAVRSTATEGTLLHGGNVNTIDGSRDIYVNTADGEQFRVTVQKVRKVHR